MIDPEKCGSPYTSRMFERDLVVKGLRVCKNPSYGCDFFIAHLRFPWSSTGPVLVDRSSSVNQLIGTPS